MNTENNPVPRHTKEELYRNQVALLKTFLANGAITQAQFHKSYTDLTEKMGMTPEENP